MQISIIIPIYKVEQYIERCLQSVICQTFTNYEVILVDDASPDNALQIAKNLLQKNNITFQTIKHKENKKQGTARNNGVKIAKGKYIFFIDADDELANKNVLQLFYETIEREKVDFITANYNMVYPNNRIEKNKTIVISECIKLTKDEVLKALIHSKIPITPWNKLISKNFLIENKISFKKEMIICEDELWIFNLCIKANKCYSLPNYLYNYYQTNPNAVSVNINKKFILDHYTVIQEIITKINKENIVTSKNVKDLVFFICKKNTNFLGMCAYYLDKPFWIKQYKKIQNSYKNSTLYTYKKLLRLPASLAYFVFTERIKPYNFLGSKYYLKIINLINRYNWEGKI